MREREKGRYITEERIQERVKKEEEGKITIQMP